MKKDIFDEATKRFIAVSSSTKEVREECVEDRAFAFVRGSQWADRTGTLGKIFADKPLFEINKTALAIKRIYSEYTANRFNVEFAMDETTSGDEYNDSESLSDLAAGLYRSTCANSNATAAHDNAFLEGIAGGMGGWQVKAEYEDADDLENDKQKICIEPIYEADKKLYFDLKCSGRNTLDADYAFLISSMDYASFNEEFDIDPTTWRNTLDTEYLTTWLNTSEKTVYVAEYFVRESKKIKYYILGNQFEEKQPIEAKLYDEDEEMQQKLQSLGFEIIKERTINKKIVKKYTISGSGIIGKQSGEIIPGQYIPLVPFYANIQCVNNILYIKGHVRDAKDMVRLKNMQVSKLAEFAAASTMRKPIFYPEEVVGFMDEWKTANINNTPFMLTNGIIDPQTGARVPSPMRYLDPPDMPQAMAGLLQLTEQDMQDILGNTQIGEKINPNISGKAVDLLQTARDMPSFMYIDAFKQALMVEGKIFVAMASEIYTDQQRNVVLHDKEGNASSKTIMMPIPSSAGTQYKHDLSRAKFEVTVDAGPSSSTKREAIVQQMVNLLGSIATDSDTHQIVTSLAMANMEGEGLKDIRDYYRKKLIMMGVVKPTDAERKEIAAAMAQAQQEQQGSGAPDPQASWLLAAAEESQAKAAQARANTVKTIQQSSLIEAQTKETAAKTMEIIQNINNPLKSMQN